MLRSQPHQLCCPACARMPLHMCCKHHRTRTTHTQTSCYPAAKAGGQLGVRFVFIFDVKKSFFKANQAAYKSPDYYRLHSMHGPDPGCAVYLVSPGFACEFASVLISCMGGQSALFRPSLAPCLSSSTAQIKKASCLQGNSQRTHIASMLS